MTAGTGERASGDHLPYADALASLLASCTHRVTPAITVPLADAPGHALAAPVASPIALPPWDNAGMDGYAVQRRGVIGAGVESPRSLRVIGTSVAGSDPAHLPALTAGTAVRIMTGAPIPPGADAVIRVEDTAVARDEHGDECVRVRHDRDATLLLHIRARGEDVIPGMEVFSAGTTVRSAHVGLLASIGCAQVPVHRAPRVTVLSSGDELVTLEGFDEVLAGRRIVSSSSYALPALLRSAGATVTMAPLVPDTLEAMTAAMDGALSAGCDLLVTTGGVSVGEYDFTRDALKALGGTQRFWRARIRPGGPIGTGMLRSVPWIGLPGNPVSTLVTAILFAWPLLRQLGGHGRVHHLPLSVRATEGLETPAPLTYFLRARLALAADGVLEATTTGAQGSHLQRSMAFADALIEVPEAMRRVEPGTMLRALAIPDGPLTMTA